MSDPTAPLVSVIVANHNGAAWLEDTLRTILAQSVGALEVILSDDASGDRSVAIATDVARRDPRVRVLASPVNLGPAGARNRALAEARGTWIAIVDSDDLIHPRRFERLIGLAEAEGLDIVADDPIAFHSDRSDAPFLLLPPGTAPDGACIDPSAYVRANRLGSREPPLGYVKPMIRAHLLRDIRYDETLRIAEDYDLVLRLLLAGARFSVFQDPLYLYRRHSGSISHRLSVAKLEPMIAADRRMREALAREGRLPPALDDALRERAASLGRALAFEHLVAALRERKPGRAAGLVLRHPAAVLGLREAVRNRVRRLRGRAPAQAPPPPARYRLVPWSEANPGQVDAEAMTIPFDPALELVPAEGGPAARVAAPVLDQALRIVAAASRPVAAIEAEGAAARSWSFFLAAPGVDVVGVAPQATGGGRGAPATEPRASSTMPSGAISPRGSG